ncbi:MAG TPA: hypothetical protein V6C69_11160 [Trichormus sp.]
MKVRNEMFKVASVAGFLALVQLSCVAPSTAQASDNQDGDDIPSVVRGNQLSYSVLPSPSAVMPVDSTFVQVRPFEHIKPHNSGVQECSAAINGGDSQATVLSNPHLYFMTQVFDPVWNPDGPEKSKNCGPASLAMAYRYFNRTPPGGNPTDPEQFIESARVAMTGLDNNEGLTNFADVIRGAQAGGLHTEVVHSVAAIDAALARGAIVIASGCPNMPGSYGRRFGYGAGYYGHFILVTAHQGSEYMVSDPLNRRGPSTVDEQEMRSFLRFWPTFALKGGIAIWND